YIGEMRQVQPQGPYLVGGFSGGGLIAWEIARQLEEAGETVAVTVLLDTPLPMRPVPGRVDKALIKLAMLREEGPAYLSRWAREKAEWKRAQRNSRAVEDAHQLHNSAIEAAFYAALPRFDMVRRDGRVVLLRPALDRRFKVSGGRWISAGMEYVMKDNGLTPLAPALEVIEVPGDHDSMVLEPNVRVLASHLRRILTQAESAPARQAAE
ncbi:MAG: thioesterase domain-containing protein, partial [Gemmobacter sp.]